MSYLAALLLGVVQGLTEFLPISSTAHVALAARALSLPDDGMAAFTAVLQLGTLLAVLAYFARDLWRIAGSTLVVIARPRELRAAIGGAAPLPAEPEAVRRRLEARLGLYIVIGTVPLGLVGFALKSFVEHQARSPAVMAGSLVALALVLYAAERLARHRRGMDSVTLTDALVIGGAQVLALVPGASRSGVTLTAALLMGFRRDDAARFSFLLSVPAVLAAGLFEMKDAVADPVLLLQGAGVLVVGTLAAFVVGYASIAWLLRFLRTRTTMPFVAYRVGLGLLLAALLAAGLLG